MIRELGPCQVIYDGVDLGSTSGGVTFRYTEDSKPVKEDQKGSANVDEISVGASVCEVEMALTRSTLTQLAKIIGGNTLESTKLTGLNKVGVSMYDNSALLTLKPIVNNVASAIAADWLNIPHAYPKVDMEVVFDSENQRVYKTLFKGFPDASTGAFWFMGA